MIEIQTKQNTVKVFTDSLDKQTKQQIAATARDPAYADSRIRVMPDTHAGRGCVIGMTMTLHGRVSPSLVGVDIGCGMEVVKLADRDVDLPRLDEFIRDAIPAGKKIYDEALAEAQELPLSSLHCASQVDLDRARRSLGTLGGGNHFIEVDKDTDGTLYLVIHSGSRSVGAAIAHCYQDEAYRFHCKKARRALRTDTRDRLDMEAEAYGLSDWGEDTHGTEWHTPRRNGATKATRRSSSRNGSGSWPVKWETATCEGRLYEAYLHDMAVAVRFAEENRRSIAARICNGMGLHPAERFSCTHNYIDEDRILRKGAISARQGEFVFIPLNMRDGALIGRGRGNPDWNFSAPHGAGRACSRSDARYAYDVETFQAVMQAAGVYTTTANRDTLDECPMAYKSLDRILPHLDECVYVDTHAKPIYNFKACE